MQPLLDILALRERWRQYQEYSCFLFSPDNEKGLRLSPVIADGKVSLDFEIKKEYSGFPGLVHGGIPFTILDGLMGWWTMAYLGRGGFTMSSEIKYKAPLLVGKTYSFESFCNQRVPDINDILIVKGRVFMPASVGLPKLHIEMSANFYLPKRKAAEKIFGVGLEEFGSFLFPDS